MNKQLKYQFWKAHIIAWKKSELPMHSYCMAHQLAKSTFADWIRKVQITEEELKLSVEVDIIKPTNSQFSEVKITEALNVDQATVATTSCSIRFNGFQIHCQSLPNPSWILEMQNLMARVS